MINLIHSIFQDTYTSLLSNDVLMIILFTFFGVATITDLKSKKIYNIFNLIFFATRLVLGFIPVCTLHFTIDSILGGILCFAFLTIPAIALMHKMGGDIKFLTVVGLFLGFKMSVILLLISCTYMLIYSLIRKIIDKSFNVKTIVPFAPFFSLGLVTIYIIANVIC